MSRSIPLAAALLAALSSPSQASGPSQPVGMAHAFLEPASGAPVDLLFPAVPGIRYEFLDDQTGHRFQVAMRVARVAPGEFLQVLEGCHPTLGKLSLRTRRFAGRGIRLEAVGLRHHPLDLSDDPLSFSHAPEVLPGQRFEANPAQRSPHTGGRLRWALRSEALEDQAGAQGHGYSGALRYHLEVHDLGTDTQVGEVVLVLAPGVGPVRLRGHLLGASASLRLVRILWPWQT